MDNHPAACAAEDRAAGENLCANGGWLPIAWQTSCPLELREQIEEEQYGAKRSIGGEELFQAETVGAQVMLQLGNAIFHVGPPIVVAPDLRRPVGTTGDEDTKCITGHVDQL